MGDTGDSGARRSSAVVVVFAGAIVAAVIAVILGVANGHQGTFGHTPQGFSEPPPAATTQPAPEPVVPTTEVGPAVQVVPTPADSTSGTEDPTSELRFTATSPDWQLAYTVTCPAGVSGFYVDLDQAPYTSLVAAPDATGSGLAPGTGDVGPIDVRVSTPCRWTLALRPQAGG